MNIGKACAIFEQIQKEKYSDHEKLWAIKEVLDMPTHNGITKDTILNAFKWFFNYTIEEAQEESTEPEVQTRWIPVDEKLPDPDELILLSFENFTVPMIGRYTVDDDDSGTFRVGDTDESFVENDFVCECLDATAGSSGKENEACTVMEIAEFLIKNARNAKRTERLLQLEM